MPLPRLTEIGDSFTGTVRLIVLEGADKEFARFFFDGFADHESLQFKRIHIDAKLMDLGYYDPPNPNARAADVDGVVRYDEVHGETLVFTVVAAKRPGAKGWRIAKVEPPKPPAPAPEPPKAVVTAPEASAPPPRVITQRDVDAGRVKMSEPARESPEVRRAACRARYDEEAVRIQAVLVPQLAKIVKKQKGKLVVTFDVNAAAGSVVIAMEKRGCA